MRHLFTLALLALLLGCSTQPRQASAEYRNYVATQKPRADSGEITYSRYYSELYERAKSEGAPLVILSDIKEILYAADKYADGFATKEEFLLERARIDAAMPERVRRDLERQNASSQQTQNFIAALTAGLTVGANAYNSGYNSVPQYRPAPQVIYNTYQQAPTPPQALRPVYAPYVPVLPQATAYLTSQSQSNSNRYCNYSNGVILTVAAHQLCPQRTN